MNTGFVMLSKEVENRMANLNPFDYKFLIRIITNCVYIEQYEHKGLILNKGEWQRSYSQLQKDLSYIENQKLIVPSVDKIRCSIQRLLDQSFLVTYPKDLPKTCPKVLKLHESLVQVLFPASEKEPTPRPAPQTLAQNVVNLPQQNNKILNNNNILNNNLSSLSSNNNLDSKVNFYDTFMLAYGKMPTPIILQDLLQYIEDGMEEDLLCHAIKISAKASRSLSYLWTVLKNLTKDGIKTLESAMTVKKTSQRQVEEDDRRKQERIKLHEKYKDFTW